MITGRGLDIVAVVAAVPDTKKTDCLTAVHIRACSLLQEPGVRSKTSQGI